ncbi:hypothetical protein, partial [Aeromonas veronii]|uniref:hypothetical protein n=1 Tax=Aeromonas veronii TaxID=654 RepID=UPI001F23DA6F
AGWGKGIEQSHRTRNACSTGTELIQEKPLGNCCLVDELINNATEDNKPGKNQCDKYKEPLTHGE